MTIEKHYIFMVLAGLSGGLLTYIVYLSIKLIDRLTGLHLHKFRVKVVTWYAKLVSYNYSERYTINGKNVTEVRTLKDKESKQYQDVLLKLRVPPGHRAYRLDTKLGRLQRLDLDYKNEGKSYNIESLHPYGFLRILSHSYYFTALNDFNAEDKIRKKLNLTAEQWKEKQN